MDETYEPNLNPNQSGVHFGPTCSLPRIHWWHRVGTVWCCPVCHKLWFVDLWSSFADSMKEWSVVGRGTR